MSDVPVELRNPLVNIGVSVFAGQVSSSDAFNYVGRSDELAGLNDDQLLKLLHEADQYWRDALDDTPWIAPVYASIVCAAAEARLKAVGAMRKGMPKSAALDERMVEWIDTVAWAELEKGISLLIIGAAGDAFETFVKAWSAARGLPDHGQLRLPETLCACLGRLHAARMSGGDDPTAVEEIRNLLAIPGREAEARQALEGIEKSFERIAEASVQAQTKLAKYRHEHPNG